MKNSSQPCSTLFPWQPRGQVKMLRIQRLSQMQMSQEFRRRSLQDFLSPPAPLGYGTPLRVSVISRLLYRLMRYLFIILKWICFVALALLSFAYGGECSFYCCPICRERRQGWIWACLPWRQGKGHLLAQNAMFTMRLRMVAGGGLGCEVHEVRFWHFWVETLWICVDA